ncbi:DUF4225 domain-containing protein [Pseudomonas sp. Z3-8]|uniref:DUF4225 domain-containing protein n=1 Tax=Pseudomonas sp. Z3-8 TaxID=2817412 RepID=UPI003DAA3A40
MKQSEESCQPSSCDYWTVSQAAANLSNQACTLAARHISDGTLRIQFNREVAYYARGIVNDVAQGRKSPEQGLQAIKDEQGSLLEQSWEIAKKGAGAIAGAMQIATGGGICYVSAGTLCLVAGVPIMAHGANNVYENGRNLWEGRSDTEGPVRQGYHAVSKTFGGGDRGGNIAYGMVDLTMSVYGLGRMVVKKDTWRLFRYVDADRIRAYKTMGKDALILEGASNTMTIRSIYLESEATDE